MDDRSEEKISNANAIGELKSLLIPSTLLESAVDILRDNLRLDHDARPLAYDAEVLAIIKKIEESLSEIKKRLLHEENESSKNQRRPSPNNNHQPPFPPPPFVKGNSNLTGRTEQIGDIVEEEASSLSTVSSKHKDEDLKPLNDKGESDVKDDENLTRSMIQIGPLHTRRKSRRMSLPFFSQEEDGVSTMNKTLL